MRHAVKCAIAAAAPLLMAFTAPAAFAGGTKFVTNASKFNLTVALFARDSSQPCCVSLPAESRTQIPAGQTVNITFGDDSNPFLNEVLVQDLHQKGVITYQDYTTTATGTGKLLDAVFNTNSYLVITYKPATFSFGITGNNLAPAGP